MLHKHAVPLTKRDKQRMAAIHNLPCVACTMDGHDTVCGRTEAHHPKSGNKRIGHQETVALGAWHHRAQPLPGYTIGQMELVFGPSLARSPRSFKEQYGDDVALVAKTNQMLSYEQFKPSRVGLGITDADVPY